ncbi:hypothetical protein TraAM80_06470 [Trypanosoma rangeli]|uniref:Uncharacterized protein n=1 Tax=Trypanosoma rangeli TaxID=5698 RepID=A0A3R7N8W2_TRYRA|nr:uncharacterized protein TraAM80_06470 [Trypanosoma rangeli]RNF02342.1 hypothetical protein TraAM80_06470 [Trypanosoma rangeli]|eukprot:RNF02342.1 hypothetical protein TraAM80_06470 [Trypanosoma rangeli]
MTSAQDDASLGVVERQTEPKRRRHARMSAFSSVELHERFERHVAKAQNLFLQNDKDGAEREATLALRIHPTDHLFALLAVIADSKGQRDRASDFRLLQAFLANDTVLWEELLHEFLQEELYYKSAVCLQRLSALEMKDKTRYRTLQLQLADLYIGLGEFKRAANILVSLWNGSRCRDFEVFALLSSLFFQLGRWNSLHRLIESSLKNTFRTNTAADTEQRRNDANDGTTNVAHTSADGDGEAPPPLPSQAKRRTSKRVRFFGDDENNEGADDDGNTAVAVVAKAKTVDEAEDVEWEAQRQQEEQERRPTVEADYASRAVAIPSLPAPLGVEEGEEDEFDFSNLAGSGGSGVTKTVDATPSKVVSSLYGDTIELRTPAAKRNFLTLVNVHAELLNEEGKFLDTIRLVEFTAGCLQVPLLELPPELLVRLGVAYAFLGGLEQQCREVFQHLIDTCPMTEYGDVLYDAANALQQVGLHAEAHMLFQTLRRYHEFCLSNLTGSATAADSGSRNSNIRIEEAKEGVDNEELTEVKTVFVASLFAEGQCEASLGNSEVAYSVFRRVLEVDPTHLQVRLALGRMYMYDMKDTDQAVAVLTPREDEQPLERIQLGAELVRVFARAEKYVEAIALGVSVFELIFSGEEGGDADSVAPGTSRRSTAALLVPTLSRASSAIVPPSAIADIVHGPRLGSAASSVGRLSHTLATSIKAASAVFRANLARRGYAPLTNSVYGASAAASAAAGWVCADEEERLKDSSTIFRFNRTKKRLRRAHLVNRREYIHNSDGAEGVKQDIKQDLDGDAEEEEAQMRQEKKRQRVEEVTRRGPDSFWKGMQVNNEAGDAKADSENGNNDNVRLSGRRAVEKPPRADCGQLKEEVQDEGDLAELEETAMLYSNEDGDTTTQYELPSLEEVSRQFDDPAMQELFMKASSNEATIAPRNLWEPKSVAPSPMSAGGLGAGPFAASTLRVTVRDALGVLGRVGFVELAVTVINCYSAIGKFTEAKEFAFLVLMRCPRTSVFLHAGVLERPLRLAVLRAALASKESEDAYRVGVRLLQEHCSEAEKNQVVELLFGVLNRVEDGSAVLLRLVADRNKADTQMLVLLGNRYFLRRSYVRALNLYLAAAQRNSSDVLVCFLVGLSYLFISHQKKIRAREACVVAGWHYLSRYQELLRAADAGRAGEAVYNCARALQYLGLHHLAVPLYEQVAYEFSVPEYCTVALQRAARFNLYFTYRWRTGNTTLAMAALHQQQSFMVNTSPLDSRAST